MIPHPAHRKCADVIKQRAAEVRAEWNEDTEYDRRSRKNSEVDYGKRVSIRDED